MFRSTLTLSTLAALIALGSAGHTIASSRDKKHAQELSAVLGAQTSPIQAIQTAEQQTGGRAIKVDIERKQGAYVYEIKTVAQDQVIRLLVDPASGQVVRTDVARHIETVTDQEDQDEIAQISASATTLIGAMTAAEAATGGKAIKAELEHEDGEMLFEVQVAKDTTVQKVLIDSTTGQVVNLNAAEEDEHMDD